MDFLRTHSAACAPVAFAILMIVLVAPAAAQLGLPIPLAVKTDTIRGDLILTNNQTRTIENTRLTIIGNIYVSGSARLSIRQSIISVIHSPREEMFVSDSATVEVDTSWFTSFVHSLFNGSSRLKMNSCFFLNLIDVSNQAQAVIRNSYIFYDKFGIVQGSDRADVLVENSVVGAIGLSIPQNLPVTIDSLRPGYFERWSAREKISSNLEFNIVLNKTEVKDNPGYSGGYEMGWAIFAPSSAALNISNSVLNKLVIWFTNEDVRFADLALRIPSKFDYRSIHAVNMTIQGQWGIHVTNGEATIENSNGVWLWPIGSKNTIVKNTAVNEFDPRNYTGIVRLTNSSMTNGFEIFDSSDFRMEGSVKMLEIGPAFASDSRMTRNYEVQLLKASDGSPWAGAVLILKKGATEIWRGTTDASGKTNFDIPLDVNNYRDKWTLTSSDVAIKLNKQISIYTSTPVVISLDRLPNASTWVPAIYVDKRSPSTGLGTKESPFSTILEGVSEAAGGAIVRVAPGEYAEDVSLGDDVVLRGLGADRTTILGNVYAWNVTGAEICGFTIRDTNTAGIHCSGASLKITNNAIVSQPHNGIHSSRSSLTIINNVLIGNGHNGILLLDSSNAIVKNNIIVKNGQAGISRDSTSSAQITYNDLWSNQLGSYGGNLSGDASNISANPMFVDTSTGDFHLQNGSPCIDAGDPSSQYNDANGTRNDMGAFGGPLGGLVSAVENEMNPTIPSGFVLHQNYPNPFNPSTNFEFRIADFGNVSLKIYSVLGEEVATVVNENLAPASYRVTWDATAIPSGVYFYRLQARPTGGGQAGSFVETKRLMLLK